MVACSTLRKDQCKSECEWIKGKGCRKVCPSSCKVVVAKCCPPGKVYHSPTNRCRKIKEKKKCPPGKVYYSPTKRCRNIKEKKKCPPGKVYYSPTKRCRKIRVKSPNQRTQRKQTVKASVTTLPYTNRNTTQQAYTAQQGYTTNTKNTSMPKQQIQNAQKCPYAKLLLPDGSGCNDVKLIDSGAYGCVITPPVSENIFIIKEYIAYTERDNNDVGKVFKKGSKDFVTELRILQKIKSIDPTGKFTIKLKGAQKISGDVFRTLPPVLQCLNKKTRIPRNTFYQIVLEYGGIKVNAKYSLSFSTFIKFFKTFLEGIMILQNNNLVHRDIKPDNILISPNKINLIDFGLSCSFDEVYTPKSLHILSFQYPYYPPEFYIANIMIQYRNIYDGRPTEFPKLLDRIYSMMDNNDKYFSQHFMTPDLQAKYQSGVSKFINELKARGYYKISDIFTKEIIMKADIFSLAYIIAAFNKNIQYTDNNQKVFIDYIYNRCIEGNPYQRITVNELYNELNQQLNRINQPSVSQQGGKLLKQTSCDKVPSKFYGYDTPSL
jgi:serine/threonine protein kinase